MSELHGVAVTDENGQQLNTDELADLLSTADKVEFWFEKLRRGKVVKRAKISIDVDTENVTGGDVARYRRAIAQNAAQQDEVRGEAKSLGLLDDEGKDTNKNSPEKAGLLLRLGELNDDFNAASALLLAKLVVSEPIAGKDLSDPHVLCEREGIGPVAREALYDYFFGVWDEPEAETGKSEIVNIESVSDSSEATVTEAIVPVTS